MAPESDDLGFKLFLGSWTVDMTQITQGRRGASGFDDHPGHLLDRTACREPAGLLNPMVESLEVGENFFSIGFEIGSQHTAVSFENYSVRSGSVMREWIRELLASMVASRFPNSVSM